MAALRSQALRWCECDGRAVGEGDYWAGCVGRCKGETWERRVRALLAAVCSRYIRDGLLCLSLPATPALVGASIRAPCQRPPAKRLTTTVHN